ncbi:FG-GAP-like repeat-containing protein [Streptomyces sp. NPDC050504]|uniref:FG-GAP-like repeat-containing protein n=1 Tax=Streptomyces sp. NPDC050504 TaxID=3365618 RepID=UPI003797CC27
MRKQVLVRAAVAVATGVAAPLTALAPASSAVAAEPPYPLTIPSQQQATPGVVNVVGTGTTGYLWGDVSGGYYWTKYADGATERLELPYETSTAWIGGSDTVIFSGNRVVQRNMATGQERLMAGSRVDGVAGEVAYFARNSSSSSSAGIEFFEAGSRGPVSVPSGASETRVWSVNRTDRVAAAYKQGDAWTYGWATRGGTFGGTVYGDASGRPYPIKSSGDYVAQWTPEGGGTLFVTTFGLNPGIQRHALPGYATGHLLGLAGNYAVIARGPAAGSADPTAFDHKVVLVPLAGGNEITLFDKAAGTAETRPTDKGVLVVRQGGATGLETVAVVPSGNGYTVKPVATAPLVRPTVHALTFAQGHLDLSERVQGAPLTKVWLRGIDVSATVPPTAGPRTERGFGAWAAEYLATGDGRLVHKTDDGLRVVEQGGTLPGRLAVESSAYAYNSDVQVSGRYALVRNYTEDGQKLFVFDIDTGKPVHTGPVVQVPVARDYALFGPTLWTESAPGKVDAVDVRTGRALRSVTLADCDINQLQANSTGLYWSCGAKAGAYDLTTEQNTPLPWHEPGYAKLGDGYVAWLKDGELNLTDFRGTDGTRSLGHPNQDIQPYGTWDVDPYGSSVALALGDQSVRVVPSGVPASPLAALDEEVPTAVDLASGASWKARWWTSKQVGSWKLEFKNKASGAVVRTLTGTDARGLLAPVWDGKGANGKKALNGAYAWTLTATPADGQGAALVRQGAIALSGGADPAAQWRDHGRLGGGKPDGARDLLTLTSAGKAQFHYGDGKGAFAAGAAGGGSWAAGTVMVPFADMNDDGCNDVLVRLPAGQLRVHYPACGASLSASGAYKVLGAAWGGFDLLTSPGDLTGDGRPDLLARQRATGDVYRYSDNGRGGLTAAVKVGAAWKGHRAVFGSGDLTGDGVADVLAVDNANNLWRYDGRAGGSLKAPVKVFAANWGAGRNVFLGVGDVTGDGKADLVSRKTTGELLRNNGNGRGSFGGTVKLAGGWQAYRGLF